MTQMQQDAKERLLLALPYFRNAASEAAKSGEVNLGILRVQLDGSGQIMMKFAAPEFFDDLAIALGAPAQTAADDEAADALKFLHKFGLKGVQ